MEQWPRTYCGWLKAVRKLLKALQWGPKEVQKIPKALIETVGTPSYSPRTQSMSVPNEAEFPWRVQFSEVQFSIVTTGMVQIIEKLWGTDTRKSIGIVENYLGKYHGDGKEDFDRGQDENLDRRWKRNLRLLHIVENTSCARPFGEAQNCWKAGISEQKDICIKTMSLTGNFGDHSMTTGPIQHHFGDI